MADELVREGQDVGEETQDYSVEDDYTDEIPVLYEGKDEIPVEPTEEEEDAEALKKRIEELTLQQQQIQTRFQDQNQFQQSIEKLASSLNGKQSGQQQQSQQQPPQKTVDELAEELKDEFYENPTAAVKKLTEAIIRQEVGPAFQQMHRLTSDTAKSTSRQFASQDSTYKYVLDNYGEEVESVVESLPPTADVYSKACQQVAMGHFDEILEYKVEQMSGRQEEQPATKQKVHSNTQPQGIGKSGGTAPGSPPKARVITKKLQMEYGPMARAAGMDLKDYLQGIGKI